MKTHYVIPIFIPEKACPFRCVYCNQYHIANTVEIPSADKIHQIIEMYLESMPTSAWKRIAFFGGSFTGMSIEEQNDYLSIGKQYINKGKINELQISTHPTYITQPILDNLKNFGVRIIELGSQSLDNEVLKQAGRGHTVEDVERASHLILKNGFQLGLQMMIGLPGDTYEKTMKTAQKIVDLGANYTRIYPTLVIKDTHLEKLYQQKKYTPLHIDEAVCWSKDIMKLFDNNTITVLRIGLHPSEGLINKEVLIAGPFHVSFRELVDTARWKEIFKQIKQVNNATLSISVNSKQYNAAIGYKKGNKNDLLKVFKKVEFLKDDSISDWNIDYTIQ